MTKSHIQLSEEPQGDVCRLGCDTGPFDAAIASLEHVLELAPQVVDRFLSGLDCASQLCRIDAGDGLALGAGEFRIVLQPSDLLRDFLAASLARNVDGLAVEI